MSTRHICTVVASISACLVTLGYAPQAFAELLPYPGDGSGAVFAMVPDATGGLRAAITIDDVPVAFKYDDAWSYSMKILNELQSVGGFLPSTTFGSYDTATGTGGLDALITTRSAGQNNNNIGPSSTTTLEEPTVNDANPSAQTHWWGQGDQNNDGSSDTAVTHTVGDVLSFLQDFDPSNTTPTFYLDLNQTGANTAFLLGFSVTIGGKEWALDAMTQPGDGSYDPGSLPTAFGPATFTGASGNIYSVNHNLGSGKADFAAFFPTMDLTVFDPSDEFVVRIDMAGLNDGGEEFFMTGRIGLPPARLLVPEPAAWMAWLGLGACGGLGMFWTRRRAAAL